MSTSSKIRDITLGLFYTLCTASSYIKTDRELIILLSNGYINSVDTVSKNQKPQNYKTKKIQKYKTYLKTIKAF